MTVWLIEFMDAALGTGAGLDPMVVNLESVIVLPK